MDGKVYLGGTENSKLTCVRLPASCHYNVEAKWRWLNTDTGNYPSNYADSGSSLVYCGGSLYQWVGTNINVYNPNTGAFIKSYTVSATRNISYPIITDGERYLWFQVGTSLYEFDTTTGQETVSTVKSGGGLHTGICYDPVNDGIILYSGYISSETAVNGSIYFYSRKDGTTTSVSLTRATGNYVSYMYLIGTNLYIGLCKHGTVGSSSGALDSVKHYVYDTNTWKSTLIFSYSEVDALYSSTAYIDGEIQWWDNLGRNADDVEYHHFDLNNGFLALDKLHISGLPNLGGNSKHNIAHHGNYLWSVGPGGMMICPLYSETLNYMPIVAKIYKGQKFYASTSLELPEHGITVTTEPQVAQQDITIKKAQYNSNGSIRLFIEN